MVLVAVLNLVFDESVVIKCNRAILDWLIGYGSFFCVALQFNCCVFMLFVISYSAMVLEFIWHDLFPVMLWAKFLID